MLRDLLKENDHLVKIDLKDAYFTIPIWKNHQKYLRFLWKDTLLEFTCLPFGLASEPLVFTKILRPVVALLRKQGVRLIIYLDDILIMAESVEFPKTHANLAVSLLVSLGFMINHKKTVLTPSQQLEFLGFTVNSVTMTLSLTHDKLRQIKRESQQHGMCKRTLSVSREAKCIHSGSFPCSPELPSPAEGKTSSSQSFKGLRSISNLYSRSQRGIDLVARQPTSLEWQKSSIKMPRYSYRDRCFICRLGGSLWGPSHRGILVSDRAFIAHKLPGVDSGRICLEVIRKRQMSYQNPSVNGQPDISRLPKQNGGTSSCILASLTYQIWQWCLNRDITIVAQHLPGYLNIIADEESRSLGDSSDWKLMPEIIQQINLLWGPLEIDLFASRLTNQLPRYVSWKPDPGAEATDAFSLNWAQHRGYAFPPFVLIGRCLKQVIRQQAPSLVIVTPVWEMQSWFPLLLELCVDQPLLLPPNPNLLTRDQEQHPLQDLVLAAWLVSANSSRQTTFRRKLKPFSCAHGVNPQQPVLTLLGNSGLAGVYQNKLILFQHL